MRKTFYILVTYCFLALFGLGALGDVCLAPRSVASNDFQSKVDNVYEFFLNKGGNFKDVILSESFKVAFDWLHQWELSKLPHLTRGTTKEELFQLAKRNLYFTLRYYDEGATAHELQKESGVSHQTIRKAVYRTIHILRAALSDQYANFDEAYEALHPRLGYLLRFTLPERAELGSAA